MAGAELASTRKEGEVGWIDLTGQIDRNAEEAVNAAYDQVAGNGTKTVALNFTNVDYINSTGIAVIVGLLAKARREGLTISAYGLTDHYKHIFEITRLSDFMTIKDESTTPVAGGMA